MTDVEKPETHSAPDKTYSNALRRLELPAEVRKRSTFWIAVYAAKPHLLLVLGILVLALAPVWLGVPLSALAMLAAQRHFQTLIHDASHLFFHEKQKTNDLLANWLCAGWIGMEVGRYRKVHLQHHRHNGSALDPEHVSFATVRESGGLAKMILKYAIGMEAIRLVQKYFAPSTAVIKPTGEAGSKGLSGLVHIAVCQMLLLLGFTLAGVFWGYAIWLYLAVTFNPLLSRLRFLAEHPGEGDTTVTTLAPLLENVYFAPQSFNYHFEHHGWPMIPPYRLPYLHRHLRKNTDLYDQHRELLSPSFVSKLLEQDRAPDTNGAINQ